MDSPAPNIWQMQARGDEDGLIAALAHEDAGVRERAAAALRILGAEAAIPALHEALRHETDPITKETLTTVLQYLQGDDRLDTYINEGNVTGLIALLNSAIDAEVFGAARALGMLGSPDAVEPLVVLFSNPNAADDVRYAAAEALITLKSAPAEASLIGALRREDWRTRRNAVAVLGQLMATWATPALANALYDSEALVRQTARAALRRIDTPAARDALADAIRTQWQPAISSEPRRAAPEDSPPEATAALETPPPAGEDASTASNDAPQAGSAPSTGTPEDIPATGEPAPAPEDEKARVVNTVMRVMAAVSELGNPPNDPPEPEDSPEETPPANGESETQPPAEYPP